MKTLLSIFAGMVLSASSLLASSADQFTTTNLWIADYSVATNLLHISPFHALGESAKLDFVSYAPGSTNTGTFLFDSTGFFLSPNLSVLGDLAVIGNLITSTSLLFQTNVINQTVSNALTANYAKTCTGVMYTNVYRALLSQTNTAAPVAIVLENTFGYGSGYTNLVWSRIGLGKYTVTFTNGFPLSKTFCRGAGTFYVNVGMGVSVSNVNTIYVTCFVNSDSNPLYYDSVLGKQSPTPFEILVYP